MLVPGDPLAHRALDSLLRAESTVRRRLSGDLEREGISATGFSVLIVLSTAGGELELRALRARLRTSKANATEVVTTLEGRGLVQRFRLPHGSATVLTWGGLRGGISVALALSLPAGASRDPLLTLTYCVVVFSILVQGLTIVRVVKRSLAGTVDAGPTTGKVEVS